MTFPVAHWWHLDENGRVVCELCPRSCTLVEGQEGYCGVRSNDGGSMHTVVTGTTSGLSLDPIEKKPFYHFLPGTEVLSFGSVGCNMGCTFCQNWALSQTADFSRLQASSPEDIVRMAVAHRCSGVAFTYNEPIISAEFCLEVAQACHESGLKTLAVTAGYVSGAAREAFFQGMDAVNVDLKGFSEAFYQHYCNARLEPVLETLAYLVRKTHVWTEITTLLIPGANDSDAELAGLSTWVAERLGRNVPLHFSAYHPDFRLLDRPGTPLATLQRAKAIAQAKGLNYVYLGNARNPAGSTTFCPGCGEALILRDGFTLASYRLRDGACGTCGTAIPGVFQKGEIS